MNASEPPPEAHRYGRSQTPESPRPLHIPEPANIPVLQYQMDPVFNDTSTYDIPADSQIISAHSENNRAFEFPLQNQAIPNLFPQAGQHPVREEQDGKDEDGSGHVVSGNKSTENKTVSHITSDTSNSVGNAAPAQQPNLRVSQTDLPSTQLPENSSGSHTAPQNNPTSAPTSFRSPDNKALTDHISFSTGFDNWPSDQDLASSHDGQMSGKSQIEPSSSDGVNFQSLLDTLARSTATAPTADSLSAPTTAEATGRANLSQIGSEKPLPVVAGLPPRPPPQEKPAIHPNYSANESIRSYHQLPSPNANPSPYSSQHASFRQDVGMPPVNVAPLPSTNFRAANGLPPPPALATFQQQAPSNISNQIPTTQILRERDSLNSPSLRGTTQGLDDDDRPWGPDIQAKYDQFLHDERIYVTEGVWDVFPPGSRLFVGNLPTEKVTKRDLFHAFHKHGKLAQISIKQAYGFVQFLEAASCYGALEAEQGATIRGRKIHLEISKPQKNTRNSGPADRGAVSRRRSRSPERRGGSRSSNERFDRGTHVERPPFSDFRDEPARRRDDYRPVRSPSPRGYRARDEYRTRERSPNSYNRWDGRPRSPDFGRNGINYRPASPKGFDDDAALPLPRRDPRDVPDVQILILEDVAQDFLNFIEQGFRNKGLRVLTIWLNPRITLAAVIKRQIIEGVQAVVKLTRSTQYNNKIPLQVFDRTGGATNVNFNEYVELDVQVAADIVISARQKERMALPLQSPTTYPPNPAYGIPQQYPYAQPQPLPQAYQQSPIQPYPQSASQLPQQYSAQPDAAYRGTVASTPNVHHGAPNLQELLANLRQPSNPTPVVPSHVPAPSPSTAPTDLAGLLSNVARQQTQSQSYNQQLSPQQHINQYPNRPPLQTYPSAGAPASTYGGVAQQPPHQNVQNIMEQLARFNK